MRLNTQLKIKQNNHAELRLEIENMPFIYVPCLVSNITEGAIYTDMALTVNNKGELQLKTMPPSFTYDVFAHGTPYHVAMSLVAKAIRDHATVYACNATYRKRQNRTHEVAILNPQNGDRLYIKVYSIEYNVTIATTYKRFGTPKGDSVKHRYSDWLDFLDYMGHTL